MRVGHLCLMRWQLPRHKWVFPEILHEADRLAALPPTHPVEEDRWPHRVAGPVRDLHRGLLPPHGKAAAGSEQETQDEDRDRHHGREGPLRHVLLRRHPADQHADLRGAQEPHDVPLRAAGRWRHHSARQLRRQPHRHRRVRGRPWQILPSALANDQGRPPDNQDRSQRLRPQLVAGTRELTHLTPLSLPLLLQRAAA